MQEQTLDSLNFKKISLMAMQTGATIFQTVPATLTWANDDTISLTNISSGEVIFSTTPQGIKKVASFNGQMSITLVDGKRVNLIFDENAFGNMATSAIAGQIGLIGLPTEIKAELSRIKDEESSDVSWWNKNFKAHDIKSSFLSQKRSWAIAIVVAVIFVVFIFATGVYR